MAKRTRIHSVTFFQEDYDHEIEVIVRSRNSKSAILAARKCVKRNYPDRGPLRKVKWTSVLSAAAVASWDLSDDMIDCTGIVGRDRKR
jgi:hypothetical protein